MNKAAQSKPAVGVDAESRPAPPDSRNVDRNPEGPPGKLEKTPEGNVSGRDRLSENEGKRMFPGVSDDAHS